MRSSRCPHCRRITRSFRGFDVFEYGTPIRRCNNCGGVFADTYFVEIECVGVPRFAMWLMRPVSIFFLLLSSYFLLDAYQNGFTENPVILAGAVCAVPALWDLIGYRRRLRKAETEREFTKQRMLDKKYIKALKEHGFKVPAKYL